MYEGITKTKMLAAIYDVYSNPNNIIDICTTRELEYLKIVLDNKLPFFYFSAIPIIKEYAMLNIDRQFLKNSIKKVPALQNVNLT